MHPSLRLAPLALVALASLAGCPDNSAPDASDARADSAQDAPSAPDANADAGIDVPDAMACNGPVPENLAMLAAPEGDGGAGLDYMGSNASAPDGLDQNLQPPRSCGFRANHERLFAYTMRTTGALRVSTDNPGTDTNLDSVLFVTPAPCYLPVTALACNDDDPFAPAQPHVTASLVTTPVLTAGTPVVIALAGFYPGVGTGQAPSPDNEAGQFELTVDELPPVALGDACDASGRANVCPAGASCVTDAPTGVGAARCVADGAGPGALCRASGDGGSVCDGPLACDAGANRCYRTVPVGAGCDAVSPAYDRCDAGASCLAAVRGASRGVCTANGTRANTPCVDRHCTGDGLACQFANATDAVGTCLYFAAPNAPCNASDSACPTGTSCLLASPGASVGVCARNGTAPGSACRADTVECDGALFCISSFTDRMCKTVASSPGGACGTWGACSMDWSCARLDPDDPYHGVCIPPGNAGGVCNAAGPSCNGGALVCTNPGNRAAGTCVSSGNAGDACDPAGRQVRCAAGTRCVWRGPGGAAGVCVADGSAPGAACGAGGACAGGMYCERGLNAGPSGLSGSAGTCQTVATDGGACDPRGYTVHCPAGEACRATARATGACAAPTSESEPDDAVPAATALALPAAVQGALPHDDVDCFGLDVPAGASLYLQATSPSGACTDNIALDLYGADARPIGTDNDSGPFTCPRIDGQDPGFPWARSLAAGRYTVCVREGSGPRYDVRAYVLSAQVIPGS